MKDFKAQNVLVAKETLIRLHSNATFFSFPPNYATKRKTMSQMSECISLQRICIYDI